MRDIFTYYIAERESDQEGAGVSAAEKTAERNRRLREQVIYRVSAFTFVFATIYVHAYSGFSQRQPVMLRFPNLIMSCIKTPDYHSIVLHICRAAVRVCVECVPILINSECTAPVLMLTGCGAQQASRAQGELSVPRLQLDSPALTKYTCALEAC